jgi:hypothetical protein
MTTIIKDQAGVSACLIYIPTPLSFREEICDNELSLAA